MIKFGKSAIREWSDSDRSGLISSKCTVEWSALAYSTVSTVEWSALSLEERQQIYVNGSFYSQEFKKTWIFCQFSERKYLHNFRGNAEKWFCACQLAEKLLGVLLKFKGWQNYPQEKSVTQKGHVTVTAGTTNIQFLYNVTCVLLDSKEIYCPLEHYPNSSIKSSQGTEDLKKIDIYQKNEYVFYIWMKTFLVFVLGM